MQQASTRVDGEPPPLPVGFADFYAQTHDFLWRCALRLGADPTSVEDVVHDSFVVALRRYDHFDVDAGVRPTTWLFGILRNVMRNHARAERRRQARIEHYRRLPRRETRARADAALASRLIDEFLASIDVDKRAVFVLGEIEGMTGPEIAKALELNLNTANARLRSAREAFARYFADEDRPADEVLAALRRERAPAEARRRGLPLVASAAGHAVGGGITGSLFTGLGLQIGALLLGVVGVAVGVFGVLEDETPGLAENTPVVAVTTRDASDLADAPAEASILVTVPAPEVEPQADAEPTAIPVWVPGPPREPNPDRRALEQLQGARAALIANEPTRALQLVEGRALEGALERRRASIEISALCQLDRKTEAEARARAWRAAHRDDPLASSFVGVCWDESP